MPAGSATTKIEFVEGGFQLDTCATGIQKFGQVDNTYQSFFGTYVYTIRPAPSHE